MSTLRCQSCGMPLYDGKYGTELDGVSTSDEYCKSCYENGVFTKDVTLEEMIKISIDTMTEDLKMPLLTASNIARSVVPRLKRWKP